MVEGRLSELIGERAVPIDAQARIRNWNRVIAAQTKALSPELRAAFEAYAKGVNAKLAEGRPAGEYALLFVKPEPWRVEDSVACGMALVIDQTIGLDRDEARREVVGKLKGDLLSQFFQPYPDWCRSKSSRSRSLRPSRLQSQRPRGRRRNPSRPSARDAMAMRSIRAPIRGRWTARAPRAASRCWPMTRMFPCARLRRSISFISS
jgi:acyl-homoserine lactone acylase PvdQ